MPKGVFPNLEERTCPECGTIFLPNTGHHTYCNRACYVTYYRREHRDKIRDSCRRSFQKHKAAYMRKAAKLRERGKEYLRGILVSTGCQRCQATDIRVLEFHHRSGGDNQAVTSLTGYPIERLEREAAECDVVCANCHKIIHWEANHEDI